MRARVVVPTALWVGAILGIVLGLTIPGGPQGVSVAATDAATGGAAGSSSHGDGGSHDSGASEPAPPPTFATTGAGGGVAAQNQPQPELPIEVLGQGDKAPQFVVVSFDGACKDGLFRHYTDLAERTGSRFTFFLSGLCLLPEEDADYYQPPGKPVGTSAIGFADADLVPQRIVNLREAYYAGHEIGTHFLGHFCDADGVGSWDSADWRSEIEQFNAILDDWAELNGVTDPDPLPFNSSAIIGDRTPCLAGVRDQMYPVFADFGYTYDASQAGRLQWPRTNTYDLWEFPLQRIEVVGYDRSTLSMDYNFLVAQNDGQVDAPKSTCDAIRRSTYESYMAALAAVHDGNRAPLFIGNHFNEWACGAYRDALTEFVADAHEKYPDVRFVSNADLVDWLTAQDPGVLKRLQQLPVQEY